MNEQATTPSICKICLEKDDLTELISPCKCSGSIKYVHPLCMKSWRTSLLESGREKDLYRCTLCHHDLCIKQQNPLRTLFNYKVVRILGTFLIFVMLLIPTGTLMKMIIHFSALLTKNPTGGYQHAWTNGTFIPFLFSCGRTAVRTILTNAVSPISHYVNYSPFSVCAKPDPISLVNKISNDDVFLVNSMVNSVTFYALFFPFLDDRFWRFLLCRLEHFHLGFFLFGSVANIWYTCHILNDMFDIVLMADHQQVREIQTEHDQQQPLQQRQQHDHQQQEQQQRHGSDIDIHRYDTRLDRIQRQGGKLIKRLLVMYCFLLVALFWIHFNLMAFVVSDTDMTTADSPVIMASSSSSSSSSLASAVSVTTEGLTFLQQQQQQLHLQSPQQSLNQFLVELPLWMLRWITLGVAVGSVMVKIIYPWLGRVTNCIDHETLLSLPADD